MSPAEFGELVNAVGFPMVAIFALGAAVVFLWRHSQTTMREHREEREKVNELHVAALGKLAAGHEEIKAQVTELRTDTTRVLDRILDRLPASARGFVALPSLLIFAAYIVAALLLGGCTHQLRETQAARVELHTEETRDETADTTRSSVTTAPVEIDEDEETEDEPPTPAHPAGLHVTRRETKTKLAPVATVTETGHAASEEKKQTATVATVTTTKEEKTAPAGLFPLWMKIILGACVAVYVLAEFAQHFPGPASAFIATVRGLFSFFRKVA